MPGIDVQISIENEIELRPSCQFIINNVGSRTASAVDVIMCGDPTDRDRPDTPYCVEHWNLTHKSGTDLRDPKDRKAGGLVNKSGVYSFRKVGK